MKSTIKIDLTSNNKPVIQINACTSSDDLRDKALGNFLSEIRPSYGRLCFIDSHGSKLNGSEYCGGLKATVEGSYTPYTITPINPFNYELLIEEIRFLIAERDAYPESLSEVKLSHINGIEFAEFAARMNY